MSVSINKKLKKLLFALFLIGLFCFSFADFSFAKTEQEWLSEINQLLTDSDTDSDLVKDKQEWLSELEQVAKEETEKRVVEIECLKNPDACPIALESLLIDENGNIEGIEESDLQFEETSLFENFTQKIKESLLSLGLAIENGIAKIKMLVAEIVRVEKLEMVDQTTNEIFCTWIENGEWVKVKGECGMIEVKPQSIPESEEPPAPTEPEALTEPEPAAEEVPVIEEEPLACVPEWSCSDWTPLPETIACGEAFFQTRICTDSNECGIDEEKPAEEQEAMGVNSEFCGITSCDASKNLIGECQNTCVDGTCQTCVPECVCAVDFSDCNGDGTGSDEDGCETIGDCPPAEPSAEPPADEPTE